MNEQVAARLKAAEEAARAYDSDIAARFQAMSSASIKLANLVGALLGLLAEKGVFTEEEFKRMHDGVVAETERAMKQAGGAP